jgi:hypothetical protein
MAISVYFVMQGEERLTIPCSAFHWLTFFVVVAVSGRIGSPAAAR